MLALRGAGKLVQQEIKKSADANAERRRKEAALQLSIERAKTVCVSCEQEVGAMAAFLPLLRR